MESTPLPAANLGYFARPVWNASAISGEYLSAASFLGVAGLLLTTEALVSEIPEKEAPAAGGPPPGMGGPPPGMGPPPMGPPPGM